MHADTPVALRAVRGLGFAVWLEIGNYALGLGWFGGEEQVLCFRV